MRSTSGSGNNAGPHLHDQEMVADKEETMTPYIAYMVAKTQLQHLSTKLQTSSTEARGEDESNNVQSFQQRAKRSPNLFYLNMYIPSHIVAT